MVFKLGVAHYQIGGVTNALERFTLAMSRTLDVVMKTACFNNIATISFYLGYPVGDVHTDAICTYSEHELLNRDQIRDKLLKSTLLTAGFVQYHRCNYQGTSMLCTRAQLLPNRSNQDEASVLYNSRLVHYHLRDWTSALENFDEFVKTNQNAGNSLATALYCIGILHRHHGDVRRSFRDLVQTATLELKSSETWYRLAKLIDDSDDLERALKTYEEAFRRSDKNCPSAAKILVDLGRIRRTQCFMDDYVSA